MKKLKLSLLLIITTFALIGCGTMDPSQSQLPWGRPAAWENSTPGVAF